MKVSKLFRTCLLQRRLWGTRAPRRDTVRAHIMSDVTCCLLQDTRDDLEPRNSLHPLPLRPLTMAGSVRQSRKYVGRRLKALIESFLINTGARRGGGWHCTSVFSGWSTSTLSSTTPAATLVSTVRGQDSRGNLAQVMDSIIGIFKLLTNTIRNSKHSLVLESKHD